MLYFSEKISAWANSNIATLIAPAAYSVGPNKHFNALSLFSLPTIE